MSLNFSLTGIGLLMLVEFVLCPGLARAEQPKFFLNPDGTVEQPVAKVEDDVAKLKAEIAVLKKQLAQPKVIAESGPVVLGPGTTTVPLTPSQKIRFQTCVNGRCTQGECDTLSQVPIGATIISAPSLGVAASAPCPTGPCGDNCGCAATVGVSSIEASSGSGGIFSRWRERRQSRSGLFGRLRGGCSNCGG